MSVCFGQSVLWVTISKYVFVDEGDLKKAAGKPPVGLLPSLCVK